MFQENAGKSCENCSKTGLIGTFWDTNDGGRTSGNNSNPAEAESLFELFYRKTAPLHSVSIEMTRFSTSLAEDVLLKSRKKFYKKYTQVRILDTEFLINPVSHLFRTAPQTLPEPYTPRSDGGGYGCKS